MLHHTTSLLDISRDDIAPERNHSRMTDDVIMENSDIGIRKYMESYLQLGYEGLMIRRLDMPYENKRSWSLCKYNFFDRRVDTQEAVARP